MELVLTINERNELESWKRSTKIPVGEYRRAQVILHLSNGKSIKEISESLGLPRSFIYKWLNRFLEQRIEGLSRKPHKVIYKADDPIIKSKIISLLHSPPSVYNINRTSWRIQDLKDCLSEQGINISKTIIREVLSKSGYKWKKARSVLTSADPDYINKLRKIQKILTNLTENEAFFSIDEFGPLSVKSIGGKKLVSKDEYPCVPQYQASKGTLIITAALELSTNQITHFFSASKNTDEMIKLLDLLLNKYKTFSKVFLSWDAASWHGSQKLLQKIDECNSNSKHMNFPKIELAALPKSSQFLNVIESVFSGMAKAIIHNSGYQTVDNAKNAINRYFDERNEYFRNNPKRAGKKIWGDELVLSKFSDSHNCKNPNFR